MNVFLAIAAGTAGAATPAVALPEDETHLLQSPVDCLRNPSSPACHDFQYANATKDVGAICSSMGSMSGCAVWDQCKAGGGARGSVCDAFSLLLRLCTEMPNMPACANLKALCINGTSVQACFLEPVLLQHMPTVSQAQAGALQTCRMMPKMTACGACSANACHDPLTTLSHLCQAMPSMVPCGGWEAWCRQPGGVDLLPAFCVGVPPISGGGVPMRMYFHTGWRDYILFESWVPTSLGTYLAAIAGVTLGGVVSAWLRGLRALQEERAWRRRRPGADHVLRTNAERAAIVVASTVVDYALMLVAMTFNVGLFFAVCIGLGLGTLVFGHWGRSGSAEPAMNASYAPSDQRVAPLLDSGPCH